MLISIGNLIPAPADLGTAVCFICRSEMVLNHRGNFLAGDPASFCCDDCGLKLRPSLGTLLHRLRHCVNFVPTVNSDTVQRCPCCQSSVETDAVEGWHVVDVRDGRPVCDDCLLDVDPAIIGLNHVLCALHRAEALAVREVNRVSR